MAVADTLIDSVVGNMILSFIDEHSGCNQIFIPEDNVSKIAIRCPNF